MSESKFKNLQKDVCLKEPEEEQSLEPDKICPTCIPNENYMPPDWTQTDEPYLNEKQCEYQVKVSINIDGEIYHDGQPFNMADPRSRIFKSLSESPYDLNTLLKSYVRPGIRKMLRFYNKLETDEIVCASPPEFQGDICRGIFNIDYEQYVIREDQITDEQVPSRWVRTSVSNEIDRIPEITNKGALELVSRVQDYTFITNQKMLVVLVGIPANTFNLIPPAPNIGSLNTSTDQIVIKPPEFMRAIGLLKSAMASFKTFQSYFYKEENGSIYFQETGDPFYVKFYSDDRINKFVNRLDGLLGKNGFDLRGFADTGTKSQNIAFEVEVSFDKSDDKNPFTIKTVRARKKNCPYVDCSVGLENFIEKTKTDQTMLGYFSNINNISSILQNNKTPPWLDFIVDNTFPQLSINYGSSGNFEDNSCLKANFNDTSDFILNETMDLFKAIEYKFNQNKCKTKEEMLAQRAEIRDFFSGTPDSIKKLNDLEDAFREKLFQAEKIGDKISEGWNAAGQLINGSKKIRFPSLQEVKDNSFKAAGDFIKALNPCDFQGNLSAALKCISASLTLDEVYYALIKQIISSTGEEALELILQALPASKQEEIRKEVEKQFKDMPYPWDPGWQGGSLGSAVDRQATNNIKTKEQKEKSAQEQSASIQEQIDKIQKRINELTDPNFLFSYIDRQTARAEELNEEKIAKITNVNQNQQDISRNESRIEADQIVLNVIEQQIEEFLDSGAGSIASSLGSSEGTGLSSLISDKARFTTNIQTFTQQNEEFRQNILTLETEIQQLQQEINFLTGPESTDEFKKIIAEEVETLREEIIVLNKKKYKEDKIIEDLEDFKNFSNLSEDEQQELVDKQKEKTTIVATTPSDKIQQGTLGKALGNVQKALTQAYIDEIMRTATIGELQRAIENIPGADLLGKLVSRFKCASDPLVYPPIESFLSTLTFDPCSGEKTRFSLPTIQEIPTSFNWVEQLSDAFYVALREVASRVIMALMMKTTQLLNGTIDYCDIAGNLTRNTLNDRGWEGFLEDTLCPDPKTGDQRNRLNEQLLSAGGAGLRGNNSYQDLARVLTVSATQREIKEAMIGEGKQSFLNNISNLVSNVLPQFADVFGDADLAAQYFQTMGNILTPEQRRNIQNELSSPLADFPVEISICLTKEQKDLWDQERAAAFADPALGRDFVNKQDEKAKSDLADAANLLLNGPDTMLENAINDAFNPKDPDCKINKGVIPIFSDYPQNQQQTISNAITGIFKRLERAFIDDTIEANFFSSFFGLGTNTPGLLSVILANNKNNTINYHVAVKNNPLLNFLFRGDDMELPTTVGIEMKNQIENLSLPYAVGKSFNLFFTNGKQGTDGFTNTIVVNDTFDPEGKIRLRDNENNIIFLTDNNLEIVEEYRPVEGTTSNNNPFSVVTLDKMLQIIWSDFEEVNLNSSKIFEGMNGDIIDRLPKKFVVRRDNQISEGFLYGNEDTPILEETDLVYVGPNGEEPYADNFTEEDKVLGRSKTKNPRVYFLDPEKYGGTYLKPQIYIAEADHKGWLQFSRIVVPNPTGCDPKNSNFLMLDGIIRDIDKNKQKIQNHELLSNNPECTIELPFDKIANSDTLATLEGIVRATIRVHLSDFLIRTFPIFSNIHLDIERNFDNIMLNYISEKIYKDLKNETAVFASTYEGYTYALLFLEQVVQIIHRKIRNGQMESNEEIEEVLQICNTAQENYTKITSDDVTKMKINNLGPQIEYLNNTFSTELVDAYTQEVEDMIRVVEEGAAILSGKGEDFDLLSFFESATLDIAFISLEQARLASKIYTLNSVASEMKRLLKYIIKEELAIYTKKMQEEIEPRPYIYDIRKFFIGGSHMLYGKQIEAGVYDNEVPIGGGVGNFPYGDVNDCAKSDMIHALNGTVISNDRFEDLKMRGGFYLEKYVVSHPKTDTIRQLINPLRDIQSIAEFKQFLSQNQFVFTPGSNVSDYFGDAVLSENGEEYEGSIGVKYGVRLCYIPPEGTELNLNIDQKAREQRSFVQNVAVFKTDSGEKTLESTRYSFPICSFEQDILDVKMEELLNSDDNLNQDLKCYIDKLIETQNYKHLVDNVLQIKKLPSIFMIYSYNNYLFALGSDTERDTGDDENPISPNQLDKVFNDSKREARKLFVSFYKNNDRDPPNEEEDNEDLVQQSQRKILDGLKFLNLGEFSFDIRRRLRTDSPLDKDGNECQNNFGKLFKTGGL